MKGKARTRQARPTWTHTGITSDLFRADTERLRWAQTSQQFNEIVSILINERDFVALNRQPTSEMEQLGFQNGYAQALRIIRMLAVGIPVEPARMPVQDYSSSLDDERELVND